MKYISANNSRTLLNQGWRQALAQFDPLGVSACQAANVPVVVPV